MKIEQKNFPAVQFPIYQLHKSSVALLFVELSVCSRANKNPATVVSRVGFQPGHPKQIGDDYISTN